jgi:hypothetical protein
VWSDRAYLKMTTPASGDTCAAAAAVFVGTSLPLVIDQIGGCNHAAPPQSTSTVEA